WRSRKRIRRPIRAPQSRRVAIRFYLSPYPKIALPLLAAPFLFFNTGRFPGGAMREMRRALLAAGLAIGVLAAAGSASGEEWPHRTVRLIVPFASGSGPDVAARLYADRLTVRWKRSVIVENRTGAEGLVGVTAFTG